MRAKEEAKKLCWKMPSIKNRQKIMKKIDLKSFRGAYGVKSCRCRCSCSDGY
jgi:hypothetical protein